LNQANSTTDILRQAIQFHDAGELGRAETLYRQILQNEPQHAEALHLLGLLANQAGQSQAALELLEASLRIHPNAPIVLSNYGEMLRLNGKIEDAIQVLKKATTLAPEYASAYQNLGMALRDAQRHQESANAIFRAIQLDPMRIEARKLLTHLLFNARRFDEALEHAIVMSNQAPDDPEVFQALGMIHCERRNDVEAESALRRSLALDPKSGWSWNELGALCLRTLRTEEAAVAFLRSIESDPDFVWPYNNYAGVLKDIGRVDEAIHYFRQALKREPSLHFARSNMLLSMHYSTTLTPEEIFSEHQAWERFYPTDDSQSANQHESSTTSSPTPLSQRPLSSSHSSSLPSRDGAGVKVEAQDAFDPNRPLRIGFVSGDFRAHSVADFLESILTEHAASQSNRSSWFAYSDVQRADSVTERFKIFFDTWRDIKSLTDQQVAAQIREDRIDILIDLAGHSAHNRMGVFLSKPAPLQVTWLGYPNTTGLSTMDYRLTDAFADPVGQCEHLYSEKLYRLPNSFLCFHPTVGCPEVSPLPFEQNGFVTLGCFNNFAKLNLPLMKLWASILNELPKAKLLLKATVLGKNYAKNAMRDYLSAAGIEESRVQLLGAEPDFARHIAHYHKVDLGLDTFPYHGTTTTCEALWMGVPVVTLVGNRHSSRVGASLLNQVGVGSFVASSPEEYVSKVVDLARDQQKLTGLRETLRHQVASSPLTDSRRFFQDFESALRSMAMSLR
jgi:protein O-GlcNAc transferase